MNLNDLGIDTDGPRLMQMVPRGFIVSLWNVPDYRLIAGGRVAQ